MRALAVFAAPCFAAMVLLPTPGSSESFSLAATAQVECTHFPPALEISSPGMTRPEHWAQVVGKRAVIGIEPV
ncbi:hypothetical protein Kisp02_72830 [Kineosporia sp. NBRC 101731]|nr:hypothetical protein Kisp02_72830 [Kineosporia sp. NBRC 101731]